MRRSDDTAGDSGRFARPFYRCPGLWGIAILIYVPIIAYWLLAIPSLYNNRRLGSFVIFSQLFWPAIMLAATVLCLVVTVRRKCEVRAVVIAWASLGVGFYFFWAVWISHPW